MRVGVWWAAGALTLLAVTTALRISQEEVPSRVGRRLSALSVPSAPSSEDKAEDIQSAPAFRPRASRRNDEISPQEFSRIRPRSRSTVISTETSRIKPEEHKERSDTRRSYSRTRNRTRVPEPIKETTTRENVLRNRNRFSSRKASTQSAVEPVETSSPTINESKFEVVSTNLDEIAKTTPQENFATTQYTRRSPINPATEGITNRRGRTRINVRTNLKPLDLTVSGTTNTITISKKDSTTARTDPEIRSSKKLRYKPRRLETDTNLTGEGLTTINEVTKSSQNKDTTSQSKFHPTTAVNHTTNQASTENNPSRTTTDRATKVVRRPLARGKVNFKPSALLAKQKKSSDEISEDDNYPASFKALLQAKNGSTQASSPESENLSVKASQKVYSTFTSSAQSPEASENNKTSTFRGNTSTGVDSKKDEDKQDEPSLTISQVDQQTPKYVSRHRGSFNSNRNKKASSFTSSTTAADSTVGPSTERSLHKYNRKFKVSTTELPSAVVTFKQRKLESSSLVKKPAVRPSFFARRKNSTLSAKPSSYINNSSMENDASNVVIKKKILPKTSYYSRLRNKNKTDSVSSTTEPIIVSSVEIGSTEKIKETPVDMPLIFNLLNKPPEEENRLETSTEIKEPEKQKEIFVIAVASKESQESHSENVLTNTKQEGDDKPFSNFLSSTSKYYSILKEGKIEKDSEKETQSSHVSTSPIRNIQTKRFERQRYRKKEDNAEGKIPSSTTPRSQNRKLRKFSDSYSKTTEPSTNGIQAESEKNKNRYSSKFRASNIDKPIYKATVPTVTPSTAWLKFFVTDHQLEKAVEEPYWFWREDLILTTEQPRSFTTQSTTHESSIELVEGEEFRIGPDMNAISVTLPRSTLSSADLRLSESIMKPSHITNLEASQHSSSVTISIFDALAEILTSTPRIPRLSTTTEVTKSPSYINTKKTFNGVSNSITVNNVKSLENQDTITSTSNDLTFTKSVQSTYQATPPMNNRVLVEGSSMSSLNTEPRNSITVNTLPTPPSPNTPISARRPFAIKLLYSESPTDKPSTATEPINFSSTDNPSTVFNTVSDLFLTNNLLSSELTSMLSNNIRNIIQNMDTESRSRLHLDMDKVLRSLIPRALNKLSTSNNDEESILNTTPYSLEEIEDTENVDVDVVKDNNSYTNNNLLQNVTDNANVNNLSMGRSVGITETTIQPVNIVNKSRSELLNSLSVSSTEMIAAENMYEPTTVSLTTSTIAQNPMMSSVFADTDKDILNSNTRTAFNDSVNENVPLPFFTNAKIQDINLNINNLNKPSEINTVTDNLLPLTKSVTSSLVTGDFNPQDLNQVSPLQVWVLSKKARVLKMIEDLIRQHNNELATVATLTDGIQENNIPLSNRLTQILNSMTTSTEANDFPNLKSSLSTNTISSPFPMSTISELNATTNNTTENKKMVITTLQNVDVSYVESTTGADIALNNRLGSLERSTMSKKDSSETPRDLFDTLILPTSSETTIKEETSTQETVSDNLGGNTVLTTTPQDNTERTSAEFTSVDSETTQMSLETTTSVNTNINTQKKFDNNASTTSINERKQNTNLRIEPPAVPKKDYVIFGILPNNTVVRKDPNDDVLEALTEASPYIIYGVLPNNTVIRKFPNGTRVPRVMQKIDVLPISPWSLRNPYSPIHNNPAIVRPQSNPIRISTNTVISTDTFNNGTERLTNDTVNNQQNTMIPTSALNISDSSSLGVTTATDMSPAEKSTASHVLSLRTTTMLPSVDEILLNSISSAAKEDMVISSTTTPTREPTILTLDIDPETQQIRTEKPSDGNGTAVFKFIPINEVTVSQIDSNVLKLASTKAPSASSTANAEVKTETAIVTEINTQTPQIETKQIIDDLTTTVQFMATTPSITTIETAFTNPPTSTFESRFSAFTAPPSTTIVGTTLLPTTTTTQATTEPTTTFTFTPLPTTVPIVTTTAQITTMTSLPTTEKNQYEEDEKILNNNFQTTERSAKRLSIFSDSNQIPSEASVTSTTRVKSIQFSDNEKLLQAILAAQSPSTVSIPNIDGNLRISQTQQTTTSRSLQDDLKQFEEDTKLLKALLAATGQNPANFNIPSLDSLNITKIPTSTIPPTTTLGQTTTQKTTTPKVSTSTLSIEDDIKQFAEDAKLLQSLLKVTGQSVDSRNLPVITANSNVRIASNPLTTSISSNPTTPLDIRPVYSSRTTTPSPRILTTIKIGTTPVLTTLQPAPTTTSPTTPSEGRRRYPVTTAKQELSTPTARRAPVSRFTVTTEIPSTSTFSDEEDIQFLKNLKSVLSTNTNDEDPESALANRVIALAVERSLNEIQNGKQADIGRTGKNVLIPTTQRATSTTTSTTTPTPVTDTTSLPISTVNNNTPSLEEDIKQFQEDKKLLQALLKATGQDPSKFTIPTLPTNMNMPVSTNANKDFTLLPRLSSPSPFNKQHDSFTPKSTIMTKPTRPMTTASTTARPFGARIVVKDDLKNEKDEAKLLQTLVKLQGARETTTQRPRLTITGQSPDEALQKLIQQTKPASMMSDATKAPVSISTEYGKSNDALLAALLKEQGFGPTTASSLDEQLRLAALLNQVVVTPKVRRTTTTPPPPPQVQRRPILDGLAWLWQQWRETGPGPGGSRPNRRPVPSAGPSITAASSPQGSRLNWFGSGPFVGNADDGRETNRVPLEPPRAVAGGEAPARGQLVSAAINVTRAFSQFLGAALQGAAKTVQSVIQAGQRATNDIYANGSG